MNDCFKIFLSMSLSGSALILLLLLMQRFHVFREKTSRQWQYYIWLIVILRMLLPFTPQSSVTGRIFLALESPETWTIPYNMPKPESKTVDPAGAIISPDKTASSDSGINSGETTSSNARSNSSKIFSPDARTDSDKTTSSGTERNRTASSDKTAASGHEAASSVQAINELGISNSLALLTSHIWMIWLTIVLILIVHKITIYQSFIKYLKAERLPVEDTDLLDKLSLLSHQAGVNKTVGLFVNPQVSSPLLVGFFRPCIVLPDANIPEKDFRYTILHELTHYKRCDIFYKWLVQITICLHWFNPLVYIMGRKINKACEFSCDEAVLSLYGSTDAQDYGRTLLNAMRQAGKGKQSFASVTLSENKQLLKERLGAIMNFKKTTKLMTAAMSAATVLLISGSAVIGAYAMPNTDQESTEDFSGTEDFSEEKLVYENGVYYLFCDGANETDKPLSSVTEGYISIVLVKKEGYISIGPFSVSGNLVEETAEQCEYMLQKKTITHADLVRFLAIANDISLNPKSSPALSGSAKNKSELSARQQSLIKDFEPFQQYGVTYDLETDTVYFNGEPVKAFVDMNEADRSFKLGYFDVSLGETALYLTTTHDESNKVTGIAEMSDELIANMQAVYRNVYNDDSCSLDNSKKYMVYDATTMIGSSIKATDHLEPEDIPQEISEWTSSCLEKDGIYVKRAITNDKTDIWIYYNSEFRQGWKMINSGDSTLEFNLLEGSEKEEGPTLIHCQAPLSYQNIKVFLNGEKLELYVEE